MKEANNLLDQKVGSPEGKTIVVFGGSPIRRDEIIRLLSKNEILTIYGTLSEEEGMIKLNELKDNIDLILIGGRYSSKERERIINWQKDNLPNIPISQPGVDYPYANDKIYKDIYSKLNLE